MSSGIMRPSSLSVLFHRAGKRPYIVVALALAGALLLPTTGWAANSGGKIGRPDDTTNNAYYTGTVDGEYTNSNANVTIDTPSGLSGMYGGYIASEGNATDNKIKISGDGAF